MRPLIGIPCATVERVGSSLPVYAGNPPYIRALEAAGALPVLIPLYADVALLDDLRGRLDGLLLTGGGDVDPRHFAEAPHPKTETPDAARDQIELAIARDALRQDLPILGICRGMQLLNVALGGTLIQDIPTQVPGAVDHDPKGNRTAFAMHSIAIEPDSQLARILGVTSHTVNSYHHQAVSRPGAGVRVVARASDGVAEAIELDGRDFALAVQFHPERLFEQDARLAHLFSAFVAACAPSRPVSRAS
ncbi:MAG TPA: gamma-glutamyl-gamma-aminobutyrate hydrolase family protein [Ktedonobacterales bacterium]|nr:gamma-glutamyl-gamma-aminobutyrate hydrolase family protein [Ktedonobacterales bacterium]